MSVEYADQLGTYLADQRWFAGKGRRFEAAVSYRSTWVTTEPPSRIEFVTVRYDNGDEETYQLPVAYLLEPDPELAHALIGQVELADGDAALAYDALFVPAAVGALLSGFVDRREDPDLTFRVTEEAELPTDAPAGSVLTKEQSNTSVAYGEEALLKLFRRIVPGVNPDIEISAALTARGDEHVARLLGWLEATWRTPAGESHSGHLGMLQAFLRTATDGWDIALASVRDLLVEEDLHPEEVGGDFAGEAERLGVATADVHRDLGQAFESSTLSPPEREALAAAMSDRLTAAVHVAPELVPLVEPLRQAYANLAGWGYDIYVQRIHGDLHLGQTLRTVKGWKLIDFEGEPTKTLAERTALDSPVRDVAGMLRSFDYAAGATLQHFGDADHLRYRADEWSARNRAAFLEGYAGASDENSAVATVLLRAYETDKAVYEVVYEARHRPHWLQLPLRALERLAAEA